MYEFLALIYLKYYGTKMTHVTRRKQTKEINYNVIEEIIKFVDLWIDPVVDLRFKLNDSNCPLWSFSKFQKFWTQVTSTII